MGDHGAGVYAGIRAAGAVQGNRFAGKSGDRGLDSLLHGEPVCLSLPADEAAAVIFDGYFPACHGSTVPAGSA